MACQKCGNTKSSPCACKDTALTTPCLSYAANKAMSDGSGSRYCEAKENCVDVQCQECVSYCHGDENHMWSLERYAQAPVTLAQITADGNTNQPFGNNTAFTVQNGERLDGVLQRLSMWLAELQEGGVGDGYEHSVRWFYANEPGQTFAGGDMCRLEWGPALIPGNITHVSIWYADASTGPNYAWNPVTGAEMLNLANISEFTVGTINAPAILPGGTYVFKLVGISGDDYWNPCAPFVFVTFLT